MTDAFLDVLETKDFEKITINDVVQRAHVSRSTFYAQFEDKYDFLEQLIDDMLSDLRSNVLPPAKKNDSLVQESQIYYQRHFEFIYEHARFFQLLLGPHGTPIFRQKFEHSAYLTYESIFMNFSYHHLSLPVHYLIQYIISAHIGLTLKWIEAGMKESPRTMAEIITNLTFHGLLHGLSLDSNISLPQ